MKKKVVRKYGNYKRKSFCEKCGKKDNEMRSAEYDENGFLIRKKKMRDRNYLTIHHIDHNPTNSVVENLQTLCKDCHNEIHWHENELSTK